VKHVLEFLEFAGCFLLGATYLVVLRAVARAKRPDRNLVRERREAAPGLSREKQVVRASAKSVA
jgi:hypothetical protein